MNRHNFNPAASLAALVLLIIVFALMFTGSHVDAKEPERFTTESAGYDFQIITDTDTGAQYLFYRPALNIGFGCLVKLEEK